MFALQLKNESGRRKRKERGKKRKHHFAMAITQHI